MPIRSRSARGKEGDGTVTRTTMVGPRGVVGREAVSLRTFDNEYNDGRRAGGGAALIQFKLNWYPGTADREQAVRRWDNQAEARPVGRCGPSPFHPYRGDGEGLAPTAIVV